MATRRITIASKLEGKRLDVALAAQLDVSRSQVQQQIRAGLVRNADGEPLSPGQIVQGGEKVAITSSPQPTVSATVPELPVLYEDADMIVINKPPGVTVHSSPGQRRPQPTVAAWAAAHGVVDDNPERPGIVHRLDKDTSGVMVIAKHPEAKAALQRQFKQRTVAKTYIALVRGRPAQPEALIRLPIGRHRRQPLKQAVVPGAREAVTKYRTLREYPGATLLEIDLQTGRTHQIRVHFSHLHHPVVGDTTYGDAQRPAGLPRQFLHAAELSLTTPSGKPLTITSPLAPDLQAYLNQLPA